MYNKSNPNLINEILNTLKPSKTSPLHIGRADGASDARISQKRLIDFTPDKSISRYHAILWIDNGQIFIQDDKSSNGTFVNNRDIKGKGPVFLKEGDKLNVGSFTYHIQASLSKPLIVEPLGRETQSKNLLMEALINNKPSKEKPLHIGRRMDPETRFPLLDFSSDKNISRRHAQAWFENDTIYLKDTESANGTFVNGINIRQTGTVKLKAGDVVKIGAQVFQIEQYKTHQASITPSPISIPTPKPVPEVEEPIKKTLVGLINVKKVVKIKGKDKTIIQKATFKVRKDDFILIMGPSGCGKSTLLKMMCGENSTTDGNIYYHINNEKKSIKLKRDWATISKVIGYVPQKDILHNELTVYEELSYSANLRMSNSTPEERESRISEVLKQLSISDCRDKKNSNLSGGQQKRVCIALELLTKPLVLYLDEPTSPLDPGAIDDLMRSLKELNNEGTTIVMVSHKKEDMDYANKVVFLGKDGYFTYYGKKDITLFDYFDTNDTKEIYKIISEVNNGQKMQIRYYEQLNINLKTSLESKKIARKGAITSGNLRQFNILTQRLFTEQLKKKKDLLWKAVELPALIALMVAIINAKVDITLLFWAAITAVFLGINNTMGAIITEIEIYNRERMSVVKNFPYLMSKLIFAMCVAVLQALIVSGIFWFVFNVYRTNIPLFNIGHFILYYWLIVVSASILGLFISSFVKTVQQTYAYLPIILVIQIIFAGVIANIDSKPYEAGSYFAISRWGTEGFARLQNNVYEDEIVRDNNTIVLKHADSLLIKTEENGFPSFDTIPETIVYKDEKLDKKIKSIYSETYVASEDTFYFSDNKQSPYFYDSIKHVQINVLEALKFTQDKNLMRLFSPDDSPHKPSFRGFKHNIMALMLLNLLFFLLAFYFLNKKSNV